MRSTEEARCTSPLPPQVSLPALDHAVLRVLAGRARSSPAAWSSPQGRPEWVFYEGPPTANGMPGAHHIEARVFKDVFPRFKTMKGYHVARKAGWDCHGLPVELAVEKELGFTGKQDIEAYGIAEFNAKCRESVTRHTDAFAELTSRMGYWVDLDDAYRTMDPDYIESVWWSLKQIFDKGLLVAGLPGRAVVPALRDRPVRPRARAGLRDDRRPVGLRALPAHLRPAGRARPSLLVWTTTPWTLVSNTAVAVHPDVTYVVATDGSERLVVAEPLLGKALGRGLDADRRRPSPAARWSAGPTSGRSTWSTADGAHYIVLNAEYVTTEDGTGLVHQAPAFGADDLAVCRAYGLPVVNPVRPDGTFEPDVPLVGGVFFKKADEAPGRRPRGDAACCSGTCRTSTATRTAGAATPRCSTTRSRPGTSAPPPSRTRCCARTSAPTGTRTPSSTAATATG